MYLTQMLNLKFCKKFVLKYTNTHFNFLKIKTITIINCRNTEIKRNLSFYIGQFIKIIIVRNIYLDIKSLERKKVIK